MLDIIKRSYIEYIRSGHSSRDANKVNVIHDGIREKIIERSNELNLFNIDDYEIRTSNFGGEHKVTAPFGSKNVDVAILKDGECIVATFVKFGVASVNKNLNNYVQLMIGETSVVKDHGPSVYQLVIFDKTPFKFNKKGVATDVEEISDVSFAGYSKIFKQRKSNKYRPDGLCICICDFGNTEFKQHMVENRIPHDDETAVEEHINLINDNDVNIVEFTSDNFTFDNQLEAFIDAIVIEVYLHEKKKTI